MDRTVARIGAWAGWVSLIGIAGYHVALMIVAGQRVSGTSDEAAIRSYYSQAAVGPASVEQFLVVIAVIVFAVALRQTIIGLAAADDGRVRLLTGVGLIAIAVELAVILVVSSLQAALVASAAAGEPMAGLFRFWDVLYNSAAYGLEATWVLALGLAMRTVSVFPRFLRWLSPLTAVLLFANVFAIWIGIPDAATLPSALAIVAWLAGASIGLGRLAGVRLDRSLVTEPA
jgi:hypothetical protein